MKKLSAFLIMLFFAGILAVPAAADDGEEFELLYDFEEYNAEVGSRVMPDENWDYEPTNGNRHKFGSYYDIQTGNTALQIAYQGEPMLWFGRTVSEGKLHVSFKFQFIGETRNCMPMFYDGRTAGGAYDISIDNYSKIGFLNSPVGGLRWYQTDPGSTNAFSMIGWNAQTSDLEIVAGKWYRFDMITTEISAEDACADYYLDGVRINQSPVYFAQSLGFKSLAFRCEGGNNGDVMLLDDVRVSRFFGEEGITGSIQGNKQVSLENGSLNIVLSENVDVEMLISENIKITNITAGCAVTDFIVSDVKENSFTIQFTGTLMPGIYNLILDEDIRGGVLNTHMIKPVEFRTEYQTEEIRRTYMSVNFDDYTGMTEQGAQMQNKVEDNSTLPQGFRNIGCLSQTYAVSAVGRSGLAEDRALGFENPPSSRTAARFIYEFQEAVPALCTYEVSFDIKQENMYWYMYLLEPGDNDAGNVGYTENTALASENSAGNLYYAAERTEYRIIKINDLIVSPKEWHSVKLRVEPRLDGPAIYTIAVDGGEGRSFRVNRDFDVNATIGIGFGYIPVRNEDGSLYIDNVKVYSDMQVLYPEVEQISYINYDGTALNEQDSMSTLMHKIYVDFNTAVDAESARDKIRLTGTGTELAYNIEFEAIEGRTRAVLTLTNLLEKGERYQINVADGILSKFSSEIGSQVGMTKEFTTRRDTAFRLFENSVDEVTQKYRGKLVKNNGAEGKFTIAVAGYRNVIKIIDGENIAVPELVGIQYVPIEVEKDTKGILEIELDLAFGVQCDVYKTYFWTYPSQHNVTLGDMNEIQI